MSYILSSYHYTCEWCGKALGLDETANATTIITNPCTGEQSTVYLCSECKKFPSYESMMLWRKYMLNYALLDVKVTLNSVESKCVNGEWIVTVNMTIKYKSEPSYNVRQGWVA